MFVIGTAGHVDHGKSTLVQALTGIDPDRLAEEKARALTIDLGFAWLDLGLDQEIGVVDVPGHRDFIENMLAGVGGIDLALLIIAADEGVMPQTREHLAILDLLQVQDGLVVLTKTDLIDDPEWLELVQLDIAEALAGTVLADKPMVPVSAKSGYGLETLKTAVRHALQNNTPRPDIGRPRLPIDRVFSVAGFGTVVTGTLLDGRLHVQDTISIQPQGITGRVRGLQTHRTKLEVARPGSRVAVNISGIDKSQIKRGHVLTATNAASNTLLFDALYHHLPTAQKPLKHNDQVKLFLGTSEQIARVRVLGQPEIAPHADGWIQLMLTEETAVLRNDRFILRQPSPAQTIGGGRVLDPHPGRRHKRFQPLVLERLKTLSQGTPADLLAQAIQRLEPVKAVNAYQAVGFEDEDALTELLNAGDVIQAGDWLLSRASWQNGQAILLQTVTQFHKTTPLQLGISREAVRQKVGWKTAVFNHLITHLTQQITEENGLLRLTPHQIQYSQEQKQAIDKLLNQFTNATPPNVKDSMAQVGEAVYYALVQQNKLIPISPDVLFTPNQLEQFTAQITDYLHENKTINAAQTRDLLGTSRKYAIALLEYLDKQRMTRRMGDDRQLA